MVAHYFCIVCLCLVGIVGAFNVDRVLGRQNYNSVANIINRSGCTISNSYTNLVRDRRHVLQMAGEFDYPGMKKSTEERMTKSLENTQGSFNTLRAGGANPTILDRVSVDYYGSNTPLNQVARGNHL